MRYSKETIKFLNEVAENTCGKIQDNELIDQSQTARKFYNQILSEHTNDTNLYTIEFIKSSEFIKWSKLLQTRRAAVQDEIDVVRSNFLNHTAHIESIENCIKVKNQKLPMPTVDTVRNCVDGMHRVVFLETLLGYDFTLPVMFIKSYGDLVQEEPIIDREDMLDHQEQLA
jgi:hypothetical protein